MPDMHYDRSAVAPGPYRGSGASIYAISAKWTSFLQVVNQLRSDAVVAARGKGLQAGFGFSR